MIGLEVENVEDKAAQLKPFVIANVISAEKHPNADRLRVCMVDTGTGQPIQVVCGAPNARAGMKGVFSPPGTFIPGKNITLTVGTIRGVESRGMLCSAAELMISDDHDGIIELPADAPVGKPYVEWAGVSEPVIDINLTPNRPDCNGVNGIARDLGATPIGDFKDRPPKPVKGTFPCPVKVKIEAPELCPAFGLRLVKGVDDRRLPATEVSPRWNRWRFSYYTQTPAGRDYPRICRESRNDSGVSATNSSSATPSDNDFSIVLDVNDVAAGEDYVELGLTLVSPDENLLAWSVDTDGDEVYVLRFRDLRTGEDLPDEVPRTYYGGAWSADSRWFFYTVHDAAYRPFQVWRHRVGSEVTDDVLVAEEPDERFELLVRGTRSGDWVVVASESNTTAEVWLVDAHDPEAPLRRAGGRRDGIRYRVDHRRLSGGDDLLVVVDTA